MLNTNNTTIVRTLPCLTDCEYLTIFTPKRSSAGNINVFITFITEKEENSLDMEIPIDIKRGSRIFHILPSDCYGYGEFDLSPDSSDIKKITELNWFSKYMTKGIWIPANYDYENHVQYSQNKRGSWYDTTNIANFLPYYHGCLGKPKRILIFKEVINYESLKRRKYKMNEKLKKEKEEIKEVKKSKKEIKRNNKIKKLTINLKN